MVNKLFFVAMFAEICILRWRGHDADEPPQAFFAAETTGTR
jgi:hypothetical protein